MKSDSEQVSAVADQLVKVPLFASLDRSDREAAAQAGRIVDFPPGGVITQEGAEADHFFILLSGEATVTVAAGEDGDSVEVGTVKPGGTLGEFGALLRSPRSATVVATHPCRLLRFNHRALETLFAKSPRFALAFSRELAQRLQHALLAKNELQIDHLPEKIVLEPPDVTRLRGYMVSYYTTALKNVLKQHRLISDRQFPVYETTFMLTPEEHSQWFELFKTADSRTPFTYHTSVGTMALMRVVGDIGVNFKNLMHLKCEMGIARNRPMEPDHTYRLASQIEDIVALGDDRVALICGSRVFDVSGFLARSYRDYFIVLNLDPYYIQTLRSAKNYGTTDVSEFQGLAAKTPSLTEADGFQRVAIEVPEDMGFRYGKVSGDLNLVHTTRAAARIFGHPRPFIQGLCTANYVLRELTAVYGVPQELSITFAKRVFVGQTVELRHLRGRFEFCDAKGELLAFGDFS